MKKTARTLLKSTERNPAELKSDIADALNNEDYMRAGFLIHTYADSWAHEGYSADVDKAMEASTNIYNLLADSPSGNKQSVEFDCLK